MKLIKKKVSRRKLNDSSELSIPKRKSPLILFNHPDFPTNFQVPADKKHFTVSTQTILQSEKSIINLTQTTQTDLDTVQNGSQTDTYTKHDFALQVDLLNTLDEYSNANDTGQSRNERKTYFGSLLNMLPINFPTEFPNLFQSSITRSNLPITELYQPVTRYSPMATLLTPIGNKYDYYVISFSGSKFTQESIQD